MDTNPATIFSGFFDRDFRRVVRPPAPPFGPLDRDDALARHEVLQAQIIDLHRLEAIQIDVKQRHRGTGVFLDEGEGRARDVVRIGANAARKSADEGGLSGAEIAIKEDHVAGSQALAERFTHVAGLELGCGLDHARPEGGASWIGAHWLSRLTLRRAVSSSTASPRRSAMSVGSSATSPSSASARSPAVPCKYTASLQAASASSSWANQAPIMPVRRSPVPPVAMPALPVRFTNDRPSGPAMTVRCPFRTTWTRRAAANSRA